MSTINDTNIFGGGLILPYNTPKDNIIHSKEIFMYYLENAEAIKLISAGSYGYAFLLTLPDNIINDPTNKHMLYRKMTPNKTYGEPVNMLVVKFQFIYEHVSNPRLKIPVKLADIQNEINVQTDITFKTLNYLQPICPSIVCAIVSTDITSKLRLCHLLFSKAIGITSTEKQIIEKEVMIYGVGLIAMELVYNSFTLHHYLESPNVNKLNKIKALNIARYTMLKLALDTEYNHGDFHKGNILIQLNGDYFKRMNGNPVKLSASIIDFGRTKKIHPEIMNKIRECVRNKEYRKALGYLCSPEGSNKYISNVKYSWNNFGWLCGNYNLDVNNDVQIQDYINKMNTLHGEPKYAVMGLEKTKKFIKEQILEFGSDIDVQIDQLFKMREVAIDDLVKTMSSLHDSEPDKYPLLPVSNSLKNSLYNGMIGGKHKRRIKPRHTNTKKIKNARSKKHRVYKSKKYRRK
jgi:hypothetical protein